MLKKASLGKLTQTKSLRGTSFVSSVLFSKSLHYVASNLDYRIVVGDVQGNLNQLAEKCLSSFVFLC